MANKTSVKIITPDGIFLNEDIYLISVKTPVGFIGLQHGKSPFVASLEIAEMSIFKEQNSKAQICAIAGGIVYVNPDSIKIITDAIEYKEKIELSRAEADKKKAEAILRQKLDDAAAMKAQIALKKAINRISVKKS